MKKAMYVLLTCATLTLSLPSLSVTTLAAAPAEDTAEPVVEASSSGAVVIKADTEWRYKVINGYLYKRLYDKTHKIWLTDWIPS